jgi:anhydro-N-acetylmuramic acid kinase
MTSTTSHNVIVAGIMTGNSLDAVDVAIFRISVNARQVGSFKQILFHSQPFSSDLRTAILALKEKLLGTKGEVTAPVEDSLRRAHQLYHHEVNEALTQARSLLRECQHVEIDLIGFHGQTLGHAPPSVVAAGHRPYTIQLVDGAAIADTQKIVTVSDFRSDDILNGGEGAPFAPAFNAALTQTLGVDTAIFLNAGNTSNIGIIRSSTGDIRGWDCGPCNHFPDQLMREELGALFDSNGTISLSGVVDSRLIADLWNHAVRKEDGSNALDITGSRSFDPQWYILPSSLRDSSRPFADRLRTAVAFSAYCVAHSVALVVQSGCVPQRVVLFGGGWKNPAMLQELKALCSGSAPYVLPQHADLFSALKQAIPEADRDIKVSDEVGLPSDGMEAGIFAFAALERLFNKPFTRPSFTNCKSPTRCGAVFVPRSGEVAASLASFQVSDERALFKDARLSRAAPSNQR